VYVSEVFSDTWQGEGRQAGQLATFVRLAGCNLQCHWCDTPYTWAWTKRLASAHSEGKVYDIKQERQSMSIEDVVLQLPEQRQLVVITGGEPLLQQEIVHLLCKRLIEDGYHIAIETAGTISPYALKSFPIQWNVSPKLASSGNNQEKRYKPDVLRELVARGADFKFVVCERLDLDEVVTIQREVGIADEHIWIMPEGRSAVPLLVAARSLAPDVAALGWHLTLRQHILWWGDERGK
jgi:7-carboxy-7-deazaguanine synthase